MAEPLSTSIQPVPVRVCPEHLYRLFNRNRIWERAESGELGYSIDADKLKPEPFEDHHGNVLVLTDRLTVWDPQFPEGHPLRQVASKITRHKTATGKVGGSGLWDPGKGSLNIDGKRYRRFKTTDGKHPRCELCEAGDMIPAEERQFDSGYRP